MGKWSSFRHYGKAGHRAGICGGNFGVRNARIMVTTLAHASKDMKANGPASHHCYNREHRRKPKRLVINMRAGRTLPVWPERRAYRAYGLARANVWQTFLSPRVLGVQRALEEQKRLENRIPAQGPGRAAKWRYVCDRHGWTDPPAVLLQ